MRLIGILHRIRINRNIVECKVRNQHRICTGRPGINRNIVECKAGILPFRCFQPGVLIETLWNVKIFVCAFRSGYGIRINRNIVECKVASGYTKLESDSVLIETLWNVKAYANRIYKRYGLGINRNIVECKEFTSPEKTDRRAEY